MSRTYIDWSTEQDPNEKETINKLQFTQNGNNFIISKGATQIVINPHEMFGLVLDMMRTIKCDRVILHAVEIAKDELKEKG